MTAHRLGSKSEQRVAAVGGLLAVLLFAAMFVIQTDVARAKVYTAACALASVTVLAVAVLHLRARGVRPVARPRTTLGWWSLGLVAAGVAIFAMIPLVLTLFLEPSGGPGVPIFVFSALAIGSLLAAGVTSMIAWFRRDERSLLVLLAVVPALFVLYFVIGEFTFPH